MRNIQLRHVFSTLAAAVALGSMSLVSLAGTWMSGSELKETFSGHTIAGQYPSGHGFVETFFSSGRVAYRDERRNVEGRWSIESSAFCTIYDGDASGGCYSVRRVSENCFEFYFIAQTDLREQLPEQPSWTAQAWLEDQRSTCVAGSEV